MCGLTIALAKREKKGKYRAGEMAFQLYKKQQGRGSQGFGYVSIKDGVIQTVCRALDEGGIKGEIMKEDAELVLLHHRLPTSTKNTYGTTHPIFVQHDELKYDYYLAHNGVISNDDLLKAKHEKLGYKYTTEFEEVTSYRYKHTGEVEEDRVSATVFNDSECLAIEFARWIEGLTSGIGTMGGAAFWAIAMEKNTDKVHRIYFGKNHGRSLGFTKNKRWILISSETTPSLPDMKYYEWDLSKRKIVERDLVIDTAIPIRNVGYGAHHNYQQALPAPRVVKEAKEAIYSWAERFDCGLDANDFEAITVPPLLRDQFGGSYVGYIPKKFKDSILERGLESTPTYKEYVKAEADAAKLAGKNTDRLEEICTEIARVETKLDLLEQAFYNGAIDEYYYNMQSDTLEARKQTLEEQTATLGIEVEEIEKMLDTCREMEFAYPSVTNYA